MHRGGGEGGKSSNLSGKVMLVLENGVVIRVHANAVGEHVLLMVEKGVSAEIVGEIDVLVHRRGGAVAAADGGGLDAIG